ncbi:endonuclease [Polaribacter sp. Z014]|uniref:endonuclease n=1 Tax=Polaribacter sp. Z014 TaxID=2927126 RepID=UPI00201FECA8|nr:endonuclease [Polaribacter sp. Z014]MCL7763033.1 endonuclease [Polaribacter sp. Z014]
MKKNLLLVFLFLTAIISAQEPYYNGLDWTKSGLDLKAELATITINKHTKTLSYGWPALQATDVNPENDQEVLLIYGYTDSTTGTTSRRRGINDHGGDQGDWNREHVYAKSLGTPNLGTSGPGSDGHHLRPADVGFNSQRGSLKFANGSGNAGTVSGGWYPGDEWKGDVARIMMYMYIRYGNQCKPTGVGVGNSTSTPDDMIDLFLEWNVEDPVSDFERQRNIYHTSGQQYSQGNRNPFIDNAYLATRIWGGDAAIDSWGLYTSNDSEAPTTPTNVSLSNITLTTIDVNWTASTDNVNVTKYEIFVDGNLKGQTSATNYTVSGLNSNTSYAITVLAKDIASNKSAKSAAVNATTLSDTTPPTIPSNITITNEGGTSFKVNWTASTDNASVTGYDVFVDGTFNGTTTNNFYNVTGLTISTTYSVTVLAKDSADNKSAKSSAITATTTDGVNTNTELFFSEYVEGTSNNKAVEIANLTDNSIDLSSYSIKKQSNGSGPWIDEFPLSGTLSPNDIFVVIHFQADDATLTREADLLTLQTSNFGAPINFNGNDPVGLFKNGVLIDIIGVLNETAKNFGNMTLRRKLTVTKPNTTYTAAEWDQFNVGTYDGIGVYNSATASTETSDFISFSMYPNPVTGNKVYFKTRKNVEVSVYTVLGKLVKSTKITETKNNIDISNLSKGVYLVKLNTQNQFITKKLIKK